MSPRLAIIRPAYHCLDTSKYNCQEIGLGSSLCKRGWDVDFFLYGDKNTHEIVYKYGTNSLNVYRMKGIRLFKQHAFYPSLLKYISNKKYDLIQVQEESNISSILVGKWAKKNGIPVVLCQGVYAKNTIIRAFMQNFFNKLPLPSLKKNISYALAKTTQAKSYLESNGFNNIKILPVGLNWANFNANRLEHDRDFLEFSYKFSYIILYIGKLEQRRQPIFLLRIFKQLSSELNVGLILIGNGPEKDRVFKFIKEEKLSNKIFYKEFVPNSDIQGYYNKSDLFVLPSYYEIFGMVMLESIFFGVPVISYKTAGASDIIANEFCGHILDNFSLDSWVATCEKYLKHATPNKYLLKSHILNNYDWDMIAKRYVNYFDDYKISTKQLSI